MGEGSKELFCCNFFPYSREEVERGYRGTDLLESPLPDGRGDLLQASVTLTCCVAVHNHKWPWVLKVFLLIGGMFVLAERWSEAVANDMTIQPGDPDRGRRIVLDRDKGDCIICHAMPLPGREFHGTVGPPLDDIGNRSTADSLRLRLVDPKAINPQSIMPAYDKVKGLHRVLEPYRGKPILTAQEIEDVVAHLLTLRGVPLGGSVPSLLQYPANDRRSGYAFLSEENRQLQNDEFANPGMLWVEKGRELWKAVDGPASKSCASCHQDAERSMRGLRAQYPKFDSRRKKLINLEQRINRCRETHLRAKPYPYESEPLLALTTFVGFQSRGMPVDVQINGPAQPFFEAGKAFFMRRRGQLDLACTQCHDQNAGQRLPGEVVSQGQSNGFPIYRHLWQTLGSAHRMFAWCNTAVRAEPFSYGSDEYVNLELYLAWRGRELSVETPAVRR
jgi:L-cysteine S-thiosulfotransferase